MAGFPRSRWRHALLVLLGPTLGCLVHAQGVTEPRLALLIGNGSYGASPLAAPVNDVHLMEGALRDAGFQVLKAENVGRRDMQRLIREFGDRLKQSGGVGLFYFSGHAVQVRGNNYLVPVDAELLSEEEVAFDAVDAQSVLDRMTGPRSRASLVILEACRDNPFTARLRSSAPGLAIISAPRGAVVASACTPGSVVRDSDGQESMYTGQIVRALRGTDVPVDALFRQIRNAVRQASANQQTPWESIAIENSFVLHPAGIAPAPALQTTAATAAPRPAAGNAMQLEMALWDSVKVSGSAVELQSYLNRYPEGLFAGVARVRLAAMQSTGAADQAAAARAAQQAGQPTGANATVNPVAGELAFWDSIKATNKPAELQAYLAQYPNGLFATLARARLAEARPAGQQAASASRTHAAGGGPDVLVVRDKLTGNEQRINVVQVASAADGRRWSTGDEIGANGQVRAVRMGNIVARTRSGALWQLPLQAGATGSAEVGVEGTPWPGKVSWRIAAQGTGTASVEVKIDYVTGPVNIDAGRRYGTWTGHYDNTAPIPVSFESEIRGNTSNGGLDSNSGELQRPDIPGSKPAVSFSAIDGGVLVVRDRLTGLARRIDVRPVQAGAGVSRWSTGDEVAEDGLVRAVRMGDIVIRARSGRLWKLPLQPGGSGSARVDVQGNVLQGTVDWRVTGKTGGRTSIEANINYFAGQISASASPRYGSWTGEYDDALPIAVRFRSEIRSPGGRERNEGELEGAGR